eukprot:gene5163-7013_t
MFDLKHWQRSDVAAALTIFTVRTFAALFANISDCDETYNYWEPLHYIVHGFGFQTWEYSPVYALRSYAYLSLHAPILYAASTCGLSKITSFYLVRTVLALSMGMAELFLYFTLQLRGFGPGVPTYYLIISAFSCGLFISSAALLPSSFAMIMGTLALAAWYRRYDFLAVFFTAVGSILGWPFAAALGQKLGSFIRYSVLSLIFVLLPTLAVDTYFYGRIVIAPLNIISYNVISTDTSSTLYGTESWTYYFLNGALNFNVAFPLALMAPIFMFLMRISKRFRRVVDSPTAKLNTFYLSGLWIWLCIFVPQAHKEERFLFPIYPLVALSAAVCLERFSQFIRGLLPEKLGSLPDGIKFLALTIFTLLSLSRIAALNRNYHAPLEIFRHLPDASAAISSTTVNNEIIHICIGKEWYRFPSSFFLPSKRYKFDFIKSEFRGLLPKHFESENGTRVIPSAMNALNKEEPTRYVGLGDCDILIDFESTSSSSIEPNFRDFPDWKHLAWAHDFGRIAYIFVCDSYACS